MMQVPGSSLIEMALYCMLSSMILLGTSRVVLHLYTACRTQVHREDELMQLACGLTSLSNDLRTATQVEIGSNNRLIVSMYSVDYCWSIKKGKLIRCSGRYDKGTQEFSQRAQSMLATGITACSFVCEQQVGRIAGVWCTLTTAHHTLSLYTRVRAFDE